MPGTPGRNGLRYPTPTDAPDGAGAFQQLASDIEQYIGGQAVEYCANLAAIQAIPASRLYHGKRAYSADTKYVYRYNTIPTTPAWQLWNSPDGLLSPNMGTNFAPDNNGTGLNQSLMAEGVVKWWLNLYNGNGFGVNTVCANTPTFRPRQTVHFPLVGFGNTPDTAIVSLGSDGQLTLVKLGSLSSINAIRGCLQWPGY